MVNFDPIQRLIALLFLFVVYVHAGHSLWESRPIFASNATSGLAKRTYTLTVKAGTSELWPDKTIKYFFASDIDSNTKTQLDANLKAAMAVWHGANLPESFKMVLASKDEIKKQRPRILEVRYNTAGVLRCDIGIQFADASQGIPGPIMYLSMDTTVGQLEVIGNFAHEIGHAFGLLHEHQISSAWTSDQGGTVPGSVFPGLFKFHCSNLNDFITFNNGKYQGQSDEMAKLCSDQNRAANEKFSASEFLGMGGKGQTKISGVATQEDIDWDSLMMYPSGAGGKPDPTQPDGRAIVYQRIMPDGTLANIPTRTVPSKQDVNGLIALYDAQEKNPNPVPLGDPSNPKYAKFREVGKFIKKCVGKSPGT